MDKGVYCLVFCTRGCTVHVGALGDILFKPGWYIYVGSALGSGGLKRLERHIRLSQSHGNIRKWHVDHLLTDPNFSLIYTISAATTVPLECEVVRKISGPGVPGFGCSDCDCLTHLLFRDRNPISRITAVIEDLNLAPVTQTLINRER